MARELIASDKVLRSIKPGDARKRVSDGAGLYLLPFVNGGAHGWRFDYTFGVKRKTLSLGTYPDTSLPPKILSVRYALRQDGGHESGRRLAFHARS